MRKLFEASHPGCVLGINASLPLKGYVGVCSDISGPVRTYRVEGLENNHACNSFRAYASQRQFLSNSSDPSQVASKTVGLRFIRLRASSHQGRLYDLRSEVHLGFSSAPPSSSGQLGRYRGPEAITIIFHGQYLWVGA